MIVSRDSYEINVNSSNWSMARTFRSVRHNDFMFDYRQLTKRLGGPLPSRWTDLLRIAAAVYFTDRAVRRDRKSGSMGWKRSIELSQPVFDIDFWQDNKIRQLLHELIVFLSGDDWLLRLTPSPCPDSSDKKRQLLLDDSFAIQDPLHCLYSGGLDSAAGLGHQILAFPQKCFVPITIGHRKDIYQQVSEQYRMLLEQIGAKLNPVFVTFGSRLRRLGLKPESSQRTWALLFCVVGSIAAKIDHSNSLQLYESGVGAINSPLLAGMEGSQATRGTHHHAIKLMNRLLSEVFEQSFAIELPFMHFTKAQVVQSLSAANLHELAIETISCVHYPLRHIAGSGHQQCGICPACLFRRVALTAAGVSESQGSYLFDALDPTIEIPNKKLRPLIGFLNQIDAITAAGDNELPVPILRHLRNTGVINSTEQLPRIISLYRQYAYDWHAFIRQGKQNGCDWTKLIDVRSTAA